MLLALVVASMLPVLKVTIVMLSAAYSAVLVHYIVVGLGCHFLFKCC